MEKIIKFVVCLCLLCFSFVTVNNASAELINYGYQSELDTQYNGGKGNGEFFVYNDSGSGTYITKVEVTWGDNIKINSVAGDTAGLKFTNPGSGAQWTSVSAAALGYSGYSISADGKTATFTFTDFGPGETMAINMALAEIVAGKGKGAGVGGEDMANAIIKIYYAGQGGTTPYLSSGYLTVNANDKKIYIGNTSTYNNGINPPSNTPIPPTVFLLGAGLAGIVGLRRNLKK